MESILNARKLSVGGSIFFCKLLSPVALNLNFHGELGKKTFEDIMVLTSHIMFILYFEIKKWHEHNNDVIPKI